MLKLSTSYSKKVPVEGREFSSQNFHCAVELELSDNLTPTQLRGQIHETFDLVKASVESELNGRTNRTDNRDERPARSNGNGTPASNRQIKYLVDLARDRGLGLSELNSRVHDRFGVQTIYDLDRRSASQLVDELKAA